MSSSSVLELCRQAPLFVSVVSTDAQNARRDRVARRRAIGFHSSRSHSDRLDYRVRACGWSRSADGSGVSVGLGSDGIARYSGVVRCGSVWACPTCAAAIRHRRGLEIDSGARAHLASGGDVGFLTLTVRHHKGQRLTELLEAVTQSWRTVTSGRTYQSLKARYGIVGCIKTTEVTVGGAGWHPHLHLLVFLAAPLTDAEREGLTVEFTERWLACLAKFGQTATAEAGVRYQSVTWGEKGIGSYLAKVQDDRGYKRSLSSEMTRADLKRGSSGLTPFELFDRFVATGEVDTWGLWVEYLTGIKGQRAIVWSHGLKGRFGLNDVADEELVDEDADAAPVFEYRLLPRDWEGLCRLDVRVPVLELVEQMHSHGVTLDGMVSTLQIALTDTRCGVFRGTTHYLACSFVYVPVVT